MYFQNCRKKAETLQDPEVRGLPSLSIPKEVKVPSVATTTVGQGLLPCQPLPNASQGQNAGLGQPGRFLSTTTVGLSNPYYPYTCGQPFSLATGFPQGYGPMSFIPWGSMQLLPRFPVSKPGDSNMAPGYSDSLLDLSCSGKSGSKSHSSRTDNVCVARPLKRSKSTSDEKMALGSVPIDTQKAAGHVVSVYDPRANQKSTDQSNVASQQVLEPSLTKSLASNSLTVETQSNSKELIVSDASANSSLLALQQLTYSVSNSFLDEGKVECLGKPKSSNLLFAQAGSTSASSDFLTRNVENVSCQNGKEKSCSLPTADSCEGNQGLLTASLQGAKREVTKIQGDTPQCSFDEVPDSERAAAKVRVGSVHRSFPYRQHVQLPDGSCPLVDFSGVPPFTESTSKQKDLNLTSRSCLNPLPTKDALIQQPTSSVYFPGSKRQVPENQSKDYVVKELAKQKEKSNKVDGEGNAEHQRFPVNLAMNPTQMDQQTSTAYKQPSQNRSLLGTDGCKLKGDSKARQVKIKLDKQSGSQFIAELMKLKAAHGTACSVGTPAAVTKSLKTSAYRTPICTSTSGLNVQKSTSVIAARQLLLPTQPVHTQVIAASEPQRKRFCSVPTLHQHVQYGKFPSQDAHGNSTEKGRRSKSQSDMLDGILGGFQMCKDVTSSQNCGKDFQQPNYEYEKGGNQSHLYSEVEQKTNYIVQTLPVKTDTENQQIIINDKALLQVIKDRLLQMEVQSGMQRKGANAGNRLAVTPPGEVTLQGSTIATLDTSTSLTFSTAQLPVQSGVLTGEAVNKASSYLAISGNACETNVSNGKHEKPLKFPEVNRTQEDVGGNFERNSTSFPSIDTCNNSDFSGPGSGTSSLSLSPYLQSLLPEQLEEEGPDDVFVEETVTNV